MSDYKDEHLMEQTFAPRLGGCDPNMLYDFLVMDDLSPWSVEELNDKVGWRLRYVKYDEVDEVFFFGFEKDRGK